jgi:hypothetical protein
LSAVPAAATVSGGGLQNFSGALPGLVKGHPDCQSIHFDRSAKFRVSDFTLVDLIDGRKLRQSIGVINL